MRWPHVDTYVHWCGDFERNPIPALVGRHFDPGYMDDALPGDEIRNNERTYAHNREGERIRRDHGRKVRSEMNLQSITNRGNQNHMAKHVRRGFQKREKTPNDTGTPELIKRRIAALGLQRKDWPMPDLTDAVSALGVLMWQGHLHNNYEQAKRMHDAGVAFAGWWTLVHPKTHAQGTLGQFQPKASSHAIETAEAEEMLAAASVILRKEPRILHAVINVAVYQNADHRKLDKLRDGLYRLMQWRRSSEAGAIRAKYEKEAAA